MTTRIPQQLRLCRDKAPPKRYFAKEKAAKSDKPIDPQQSSKLDTSYELELSETAQSMMASPLPAVTNAEEARKQLELIRAAAEKSAGSVLSAHKPSAKSVVDLLA